VFVARAVRPFPRIYNSCVPSLDPGTPLPSIALRDEKGEVAEIPPGETLYGFFKTTCPTCELAWPYFERIRRIGDGGPLSVLAVSQDDPETTRRFNEDLGIQIRTLYDAEPWAASEALGLTIVPTFLVVGASGLVRDSAVGFQRDKMEEFAGLAARLAGRPADPLISPGESVPAWKPG
jgi:peroxiredoxin